jgi:hypothetical protein
MSVLSARISPGNIATTDSTQTLTNKTMQSAAMNNSLFNLVRETVTVNATAAGGTTSYDAQTNGVVYHTVNATANVVLNFRGTSLNTFASLLSIGQSVSVVFLMTNGATAYYITSLQVDGTTTGVTTKWQNSVPAAGNANSIDTYTFAITRTGASTYTVLASQTKFV